MRLLEFSIILLFVSHAISTGYLARELQQAGRSLRVIHFNDVHARFESVDANLNTCTDPDLCFGGFAKQKTAVDAARASSEGDSLVIHAVSSIVMKRRLKMEKSCSLCRGIRNRKKHAIMLF